MCKFQIAALSLHFEHLRETKEKAVTKVFGPSAQSCGATCRAVAWLKWQGTYRCRQHEKR